MTATSTDQHFVIVGGSLAGLMCALAVADPGRTVTVLERSSRDPRSGAALAVDPDEVTELLGVRDAQTVFKHLAGDAADLSGVTPSTWNALHASLQELVAKHPLITVQYDTAAVGVEQHARGVTVLLREGGRIEADAVVGADGHRSVVRQAIDPDHPEARFAGYTLWIGVVDDATVSYDPWPKGLDIRSSGSHYLLGYGLPQVDGVRSMGWAWYDSTRNHLLREWGAVEGTVVQHSIRPDDIPQPVLESLRRDASKHWPRPWRDAILDSIERRAVTGTPIAEYVPRRLANGRLVIVGDAAHVPTPMTGRGFGESLRDAVSLRAALQQSDDLQTAFERFEVSRLDAARRLVQAGQSFSRSFASDS